MLGPSRINRDSNTWARKQIDADNSFSFHTERVGQVQVGLAICAKDYGDTYFNLLVPATFVI